MPSITGVTSLSSGFTPDYARVHTLELDGPVFDGGAFGDVYDLVAVDGAPPPVPQIVKVLRDNGFDSARRGFETIEKLQRKILDDNRDRLAAGEPPLQALPALRALPQFSFHGRMGGQPVFGYSADRLDTAGYVPLSRVLDPDEEPEHRERYVTDLTLEDRLLLAHELAEGVQALRRLSYIHGDINPPNLFVSVAGCHVALIDFDSGAVTDAPDEAPTTFGKKTDGEWVAPEIMDQMVAHQSGPIVVRVDRFTDDWALIVGIHYLLFLCGPFFVLRRSSGKHIRDYVSRFRWPGYDAADPLFAPGLAGNHAAYSAMLAELPTGVLKRMSEALNAGAVEPGRRPSAYQWMVDLGVAREALEILLFQAEPEVAVEGHPVRLTWRVAGSRWARIDNGIGEVDEAGSCEVLLQASGTYTLTAEARGGQRLTEMVSVRVVPLPRLETLYVPAPELSHTVILRNLRVAAPSLTVAAPSIRLTAPSIRMDAPSLQVPLTVDLSLRFPEGRALAVPGAPSVPPPRPPGSSGPGWVRTDQIPRVGEVFDRLYDRLRSELTTRLGGMP